jgi:hypothetical protein
MSSRVITLSELLKRIPGARSSNHSIIISYPTLAAESLFLAIALAHLPYPSFGLTLARLLCLVLTWRGLELLCGFGALARLPGRLAAMHEVSVARAAPKTLSKLACAADHSLRSTSKRFSPPLVRRSTFIRRSEADSSILIGRSRCKGRMLRPSVVRSIAISLASSLIVSGSRRLSFARIENCVVRKRVAEKNWS